MILKAATALCMQCKSATLALQDTKFNTSIGRGVFDAIFNPPKINVSEQFLPRRTAFVYELDDDSFNSDIPTTLRRSKADCPPVRALASIHPQPAHSHCTPTCATDEKLPNATLCTSLLSCAGLYSPDLPQQQQVLSLLLCIAQVVECMMGTVDGNVLERIAKIMSYMRPALVGKSGKRLKRKDKLRMLADGSEAPLNGHLHGSLKPAVPTVVIPSHCLQSRVAHALLT